MRLDKTFRRRFGRKTGNLKSIRARVFDSQRLQKYHLANDFRLTSAEVKRFYRVRQQIEEVFRLLKQEFGWRRCRAASLHSQKAHLHLGVYGFCLVQNKAIEKQQTKYAFKQDIFREAIPTQTQFLQGFTAFA